MGADARAMDLMRHFVRVTGPETMAAPLRTLLSALAIGGETLPPVDVVIARHGRRAAGSVHGNVLWDIAVPQAQWLAHLLGQTVATLTTLLTRMVFVHAGAVTLDRRAWILIGDSGAGKTSTVAALLTRGARYLSDEVALLDPAGTMVHPFVLPMAVKPWTLRAAGALPPGVDLVHEGGTVFRLPDGVARTPAPVDTFVLLAHGRRPSVTPMSPGAMLLELAKATSSFRYRHRVGDAFAAFAGALRNARCLRLRSPCAAACADLLLETTRGAALSPLHETKWSAAHRRSRAALTR
jgi:hypothetical protein